MGVGSSHTRLVAQVSRLNVQTPLGSDAEATTLGLGVIQPLSKRTMLYAMYGRTKNNALGSLPLFSADNMVGGFAAGASPSSIALGVRHAF